MKNFCMYFYLAVSATLAIFSFVLPQAGGALYYSFLLTGQTGKAVGFSVLLSIISLSAGFFALVFGIKFNDLKNTKKIS